MHLPESVSRRRGVVLLYEGQPRGVGFFVFCLFAAAFSGGQRRRKRRTVATAPELTPEVGSFTTTETNTTPPAPAAQSSIWRLQPWVFSVFQIEALMQEAMDHYLNGEIEQAVRLSQETVRRAPGLADPFLLLVRKLGKGLLGVQLPSAGKKKGLAFGCFLRGASGLHFREGVQRRQTRAGLLFACRFSASPRLSPVAA